MTILRRNCLHFRKEHKYIFCLNVFFKYQTNCGQRGAYICITFGVGSVWSVVAVERQESSQKVFTRTLPEITRNATENFWE